MITMLGWRALRSEREHDSRTIAAQKEHDLANEPIRVHLAQYAIRMSGSGERGDSENPRRGSKLAAASRAELRA